MPTVTIRHANGSEETIPQTTGWERQRELGRMRRVTIDVERSLAESVTLDPKADTVELGSIDTVRLVDVEKGGSTWTLVCYSLEWDANRVAPLDGGTLREGDDNTLASGLISDVPAWSAGSLGTFTGALSFVFNHSHRHEALRAVERNVPGEFQFRDEGTVDYLDSLGSDKSGSVELSASAGTIEDAIRITDRGRELDGTHIRVIGAHEGEAQYFANLVPSGDPNSYANEVTYSSPRWSSADDTDWDRWENKAVTDQDTIEEEAAALADEITESHVEAKTTVTGADLNVGDWVQVVKPDADLDRAMRVHRITTVSEGSTVRDDVLLSTRTTVRTADDDDLADIQQFNSGFQGSSVALNPGPFWDAVDDGDPIEVGIPYPNLAYENTAQIQVRGRPYRINNMGAAAGGTNDDTTTSNDDLNNVVDSEDDVSNLLINNTSWTTVSTFTPDEETSIVYAFVSVESSDPGVNGSMRLANTTDGTFVPDSSGFSTVFRETMPHTMGFVEATDTDGDTIEIQARTSSTEDEFIFARTWWLGVGKHTHSFDWGHVHEPQPGIYTTTDTPSNVDVLINGSQVAGNIGNGTFETTIDVGGEFLNDAWNDLEIRSDSLGIIEVSAFIEGYDKIGTV